MEKRFEKFVVLKYDCWEYANRLWNDMALYAMALELGGRVSFAPRIEHLRLLRPLYELYAQFVARVLHPHSSVFAWGGTVKYLPPTEKLYEKYDRFRSLRFLGMLFRNPEGFKKYGSQLKERFGPNVREAAHIEKRLAPLAGRTLIGVELRQRSLTYFPDGRFLVPLGRTKEVVDEYVKQRGISKEAVGLVIVSDRPLPPDLFASYTTVLSIGEARLGFLMLARTSAVIGTNASTPNLAAWFANAPHIVVTETPMDWGYYDEKNIFFENRYATFTQTIPRSEIE